MRILISFLMVFTIYANVIGQKNRRNKVRKETLFTINGEMKVNKEEFVYMYKKNNFNNEEGYTKEDIEDYLELYKIFKLKIIEAKNLGYDTTNAFIEEFEKYKNQLTENYLRTNKITDSLVNEAYERYKEKIKASHILIKVDKNALPEDTLKAYNRIVEIREMAISDSNFDELAQQFSEDPSAKVNKGNLGYFSSMHMVYPFENAAYTTPVGEVSNPIRTQFGFHIIKVTDRNINYKIEVAHIMVRTKKEEDAQNKIFDIHDQLNNGMEWGLVCKQFSEDNNTKNVGGKLKPFGVGQMPPKFQEIAFSLDNSTDYSDPFTTPYGWHIVKFIEKHEIESFENMKTQIENRVKRGERVEISKKVLLSRLKKENDFSMLGTTSLKNQFDELLLKGIWKRNNDIIDFPLFSFTDKIYKFSDFALYVKENQRAISDYAIDQYIDLLYNRFEEKSIIDYEKEHLAEKYIDYKMLINEYQEGIMLFNLMDDKVWTKAANDTIGLKIFFNNNLENYQWKERADVVIYSAKNDTIINEIKLLIEINDTLNTTKKDLESHYNQNSSLTLQIEEGVFEKSKHDILTQFNWQRGLQEKEINDRNYLVFISEIIPKGDKKISEIKGLVIADYQEQLEKEWIVELKNKYVLAVNKKMFNSVIKELEK